ncbi:STAS domain-containing protein [Couchioplanes caeruleus]|uniref:STAS domain-containing protein n=1 Tax=Couchioplanes caeruleus TaxID=56438 RepID=UPI0020BEE161|nr:STAS domain-containing protein [Couchioplanes caeruleus]UQU61669.1 STAS domain-containing protein [Couchioplanes caeruleus]
MSTEILSVTTRDTAEGARVVAAAGDLDHDSVPMLRDAVEAAWTDGRDHVVVDLALVTFCDSAGLSLFVEAHRRAQARHGSFRLAAPGRTVRYVLEATNLGRYLSIHPSLDEALRG